MLRLLLLGLIGVAAYRIGSEFLRTIPSDFEPVPAPSGNPEQSRATDRDRAIPSFEVAMLATASVLVAGSIGMAVVDVSFLVLASTIGLLLIHYEGN